MPYFSIILLAVLALSCHPNWGVFQKKLKEGTLQETSKDMKTQIQGHRGCRGLRPENSLPAFKKALDLGITTLELDVVISKDKKVVISHEPWLSSIFCKDAKGKAISAATEKAHNIYNMTYKELKKCDCGSRPHPLFPTQELLTVHKPLLSELVELVESTPQAKKVWYNIEIKRQPEYDGKYCPPVEEFVDLVLAVLTEQGIEKQCNLQSFDWEVLRLLHTKKPELPLAMLVDNELSVEENIKELGFIPQIYSCHYQLLNASVMAQLRKKGMQTIPWTVNEVADIKRMLELGVDGIITDYPDRALAAMPQDP